MTVTVVPSSSESNRTSINHSSWHRAAKASSPCTLSRSFRRLHPSYNNPHKIDFPKFIVFVSILGVAALFGVYRCWKRVRSPRRRCMDSCVIYAARTHARAVHCVDGHTRHGYTYIHTLTPTRYTHTTHTDTHGYIRHPQTQHTCSAPIGGADGITIEPDVRCS